MLVLLSVGEVTSLRLSSPLALWLKIPEERGAAPGDWVLRVVPLVAPVVGVLVLSSSEAGLLWDPVLSLFRAFLREPMAAVVVVRKLYPSAYD
jgi:hypothetical protein